MRSCAAQGDHCRAARPGASSQPQPPDCACCGPASSQYGLLDSQGPPGEPSAPPFYRGGNCPQKCPVAAHCSPSWERASTQACVCKCPRLTWEGGRGLRALALRQLTCFVLSPFIHGQQQTRLLPGARGERRGRQTQPHFREFHSSKRGSSLLVARALREQHSRAVWQLCFTLGLQSLLNQVLQELF